MPDPTRKIDSLDDAQRILEEKGITPDDVLSLGTDAYGEENHIWQCPICKTYVDTMKHIEGKITGKTYPVIFDRSLVQCPECFCRGDRFDSVEGGHMSPRHALLKAWVIHNPFGWASKYLAIAKAMIAEHGMFQSDPEFDKDEPQWPPDMAAVILGSTMILGSVLKHLAKRDTEDDTEDDTKTERRPDSGIFGGGGSPSSPSPEIEGNL